MCGSVSCVSLRPLPHQDDLIHLPLLRLCCRADQYAAPYTLVG